MQNRHTRTLRIGTHNLGGLKCSAVLHAAANTWARLRLDVVCVQETHHTDVGQLLLMSRDLADAARRLGAPGWEVVAHSLSPNRRTAGVAILVRADLYNSSIKPVPIPQHLKAPGGAPGRVAQFSFAWGAHQLHLTNLYMPTARYQDARRDLITSVLR